MVLVIHITLSNDKPQSLLNKRKSPLLILLLLYLVPLVLFFIIAILTKETFASSYQIILSKIFMATTTIQTNFIFPGHFYKYFLKLFCLQQKPFQNPISINFYFV